MDFQWETWFLVVCFTLSAIIVNSRRYKNNRTTTTTPTVTTKTLSANCFSMRSKSASAQLDQHHQTKEREREKKHILWLRASIFISSLSWWQLRYIVRFGNLLGCHQHRHRHRHSMRAFRALKRKTKRVSIFIQ